MGWLVIVFTFAIVFCLFWYVFPMYFKRFPNSDVFLSTLPQIYYLLAALLVVCIACVGLMLSNSENGADWYTCGYLLGGALSIVSIGRVIQLLQQIRDAVRS